MGSKEKYIELYKSFRKELDEICIPSIINELSIVEPIVADNKVVGMICGFPDYIDCIYIEPEYRRKGLARQAVLKYVDGILDNGIRLDIINDNTVAKDFWNSVFELRKIRSNNVDTLYQIVRVKE